MTSREGQTALLFAPQSGRAAVVKSLLERGARVDALGDSGKALLAAARGHAEITALLRASMPKQ